MPEPSPPTVDPCGVECPQEDCTGSCVKPKKHGGQHHCKGGVVLVKGDPSELRHELVF